VDFGVNLVAQRAENALRGFLLAPESSRRFRLVLPAFGGVARLDDDLETPSFSYRGITFAERDARAASHVQALLDQVVDADNITLEGAGPDIQKKDVSFLFGSRSNHSTQALLEQLPGSIFRFEFSTNWSIVCDGKRFSLPDPTVLDSAYYAAVDDYGVVSRVRSAASAPVFVIAGLGGRATEGCGLYFREQWQELNLRFGAQDFAVVLRFPAPFALRRVEVVASASQPAAG
jgi:hypothetical protein